MDFFHSLFIYCPGIVRLELSISKALNISLISFRDSKDWSFSEQLYTFNEIIDAALTFEAYIQYERKIQ